MKRSNSMKNVCHEILKLLQVGIELPLKFWKTMQKDQRNVSLWIRSISIFQENHFAAGFEACESSIFWVLLAEWSELYFEFS